MILSKIAFRNVQKNWRHSLSALLSLSASFVSLVLFDGYIDDIKSMYEESFHSRSELGDFMIQKPGTYSKEGLAEPWKFSLQEDEQKIIEDFLKNHAEMVRVRVRFLSFQGMVSNGMQSSIIIGHGSDVAESLKMRREKWGWNTTYGEPLYISKEPMAVLVGQGLAKKLGCDWQRAPDFNSSYGGYKPEVRPFNCPRLDLQISTMTKDAQLNAIDANLVGLVDGGYKDIDDTFLLSSLETIQAALNTKEVSFISVELENPKDSTQFEQFFKNEVENKIPGIKITNWKFHPMGDIFRKTMDLLSIFRNFVIIVILIISTLSVVNTLIKMIKERNSEIGTMRSLGFKSYDILKMFIYETFYLSSLGCIIGLFLSVILTFLLNFLQIKYKAGMLSEPVLFRINFTSLAYLNAFVILTVVGLLACLFSTRQSLSKKVIENLNHV